MSGKRQSQLKKLPQFDLPVGITVGHCLVPNSWTRLQSTVGNGFCISLGRWFLHERAF